MNCGHYAVSFLNSKLFQVVLEAKVSGALWWMYDVEEVDVRDPNCDDDQV